VQQPEPLDHRRLALLAVLVRRAGDRGEAGRGQATGHRRTEPGPRRHLDHRFGARQVGQQRGGLVGGPGVDGDQLLRPALQRPHRLGQPRQPGVTVVADDDGGDDMAHRRTVERIVPGVGRELG
jgi:hypothetical protein